MDPRAAAERFALAAEMFDLGVQARRWRLQREHPEASAGEIRALLTEWMATRPGAELGDGEGRPCSWPRAGTA